MNNLKETKKLECLNWPEQFPYKPEVSFNVFTEGTELHLEYTVNEKAVMAEEGKDGNFVYKDSCVEFFIQPDPQDPHYYNFEWNAIGTLYLAYRTGRADAEPAPAEVLAMVKRESSLGSKPFAEKPANGPWTLKIGIPPAALWHNKLTTFKGLRARANFYKCGDGLSTPHYVTWAPIDTPSPDYHRPEFFKEVMFE